MKTFLILCVVAAPLLISEVIPSGDVKKGKELFVKRCAGCHELDQVRVGPKMRRVYGRTAGTDAGFPYSEALKASGVVWNSSSLDKWLTDPESLVPDNDMSFRVSNAEERAAIIA